MNAESAVERQAAVADSFKLKLTQRLCGQPILHCDNSTVVLSVKDDARVGQKTASAHGHRRLELNSIDNTLQQ